MWLSSLLAAWCVHGPEPNPWVAEELRLVSGDGSSCYYPALETGASQAAETSGASAGATVRAVELKEATEKERSRHMQCSGMVG